MQTNNRDLTIRGAGSAIRALRTEAGLSLAGLADKCGWDKSRLSKYETGGVGLSLDELERIAKALGKPVLVVVHRCLRERYPNLGKTKLGRAFEEMVLDQYGA